MDIHPLKRVVDMILLAYFGVDECYRKTVDYNNITSQHHKNKALEIML